MAIETPRWLRELEASEPNELTTRLLRNRFLIRTVALSYCSDGTLTSLAKAMGGSSQGLNSMYAAHFGNITAANAVLMEKLSGGIVPREMIRPDIFKVEVASDV